MTFFIDLKQYKKKTASFQPIQNVKQGQPAILPLFCIFKGRLVLTTEPVFKVTTLTYDLDSVARLGLESGLELGLIRVGFMVRARIKVSGQWLRLVVVRMSHHR